MKPARHNYRGDDHAMTKCRTDRCGMTASKASATAFSVQSMGGDCPCGRVICPRCFDGQTVRSCPETQNNQETP